MHFLPLTPTNFDWQRLKTLSNLVPEQVPRDCPWELQKPKVEREKEVPTMSTPPGRRCDPPFWRTTSEGVAIPPLSNGEYYAGLLGRGRVRVRFYVPPKTVASNQAGSASPPNSAESERAAGEVSLPPRATAPPRTTSVALPLCSVPGYRPGPAAGRASLKASRAIRRRRR